MSHPGKRPHIHRILLPAAAILSCLGLVGAVTPTPAVPKYIDISLAIQGGKMVITANPDKQRLSFGKGEQAEWRVSATSPIKDFDFTIEMDDQSLPATKRLARPDHPAKGKCKSEKPRSAQVNTTHPYRIFVSTPQGSAAADPEVTIDP